MPLDLRAVQLEDRKVTVEYADHKFDVHYFPHKLDGPLNKRIVSATDDPSFANMDVAVKALVKSWDLMDGSKPWPLTDERIAELPLMLKIRVCNAIVSDITAPLSAEASPDTSSPAEE